MSGRFFECPAFFAGHRIRVRPDCGNPDPTGACIPTAAIRVDCLIRLTCQSGKDKSPAPALGGRHRGNTHWLKPRHWRKGGYSHLVQQAGLILRAEGVNRIKLLEVHVLAKKKTKVWGSCSKMSSPELAQVAQFAEFPELAPKFSSGNGRCNCGSKGSSQTRRGPRLR